MTHPLRLAFDGPIATLTIDDGKGNAYVFHRVQYCKQECMTNPTGAGCENCQQGASGKFHPHRQSSRSLVRFDPVL